MSMRISSAVAGVLVMVASLMLGGAAYAGDPYSSPVTAYSFGLQSYRAGNFGQALPALDYASRNGVIKATYYLARIYSGNDTAHTNHAEAFRLYQQLVNNFGQVDPYVDWRAPFVAKSYVALALYLRSGIEEAGIAPDPDRADRYLQTAANIFDDADAQFELAKSYLADGADPNLVKAGIHWLTTLAQNKEHAGAQAYLAELFWDGRFVRKSQATAVVLATLAMENASDEDRIWIETIYHEFYCRTAQPVREKALITVAKWHDDQSKFLNTIEGESGDGAAPAPAASDDAVTEIGDVGPSLACENGEILQKPKPMTAQNKKFKGKSMMGLGLKSLDSAEGGDGAVPAAGQQ